MAAPRNREIVSYSSSFSFRAVRVVRAGEAKLCEGVRETIFLSLGLGTASCPPLARRFWTTFVDRHVRFVKRAYISLL